MTPAEIIRDLATDLGLAVVPGGALLKAQAAIEAAWQREADADEECAQAAAAEIAAWRRNLEDAQADNAANADALAQALAEIARLRGEIAVDDKLLADRQRILDALPCPAHGACVPYVLEMIDAWQDHMAHCPPISALADRPTPGGK